jgi:hypothetical protein
MKTATAQFPMMTGVASQSDSRPIVVVIPRQKFVTYATFGILSLFSAGMMYGLLTYGRIFQNYTQW